MKIKILGVGKCGSRLCYDFFAQIRNLPSSYEIRSNKSVSGVKKLIKMAVDKTGYPQMQHEIRRQWEALTGAELLRDQAFYAIVDSDLDNNEVANQFELLGKDGQKLIFPGKSYVLAGLTGGCQYHVISERLAREWTGIPNEIVSSEGAEIFTFAFSVGGGTGGGAAVQLAEASRHHTEVNNSRAVIHRMGIAVLRSSDEHYFSDDVPTPMDMVEKYNTGRFFVSLLGLRTNDPRSNSKSIDGAWLVSNDLLQAIIHENSAYAAQLGVSKALDSRGLSLVNGYIGMALCSLCNASSRDTHSDADLDARELNNHLDTFYISGFGHAKRESGSSGGNLVLHLQTLLQRTFCGARIVDGQLQGVSVSLRDLDVAHLKSVLSTAAATTAEFRKNIAAADFNGQPREFQTARRVVALLGEPQSAENNLEFEESAKTAVAHIFSNSDLIWYKYKHGGELDFLLVFIIDPFVPVVVNSMFDYIARTWISDSGKNDILSKYLQQQAGKEELENAFHADDEILHLPDSPTGQVTRDAVGKTVLVPFGRDVVVTALTKLQKILHWRKSASPRFS